MRAPLTPGSMIGILGGGQLGRMLALAAARLGLKCAIYSDTSGPAFDVAANSMIGPYDDEAKLAEFASSVDVITYEFENIPARAGETVAEKAPLHPGLKALRVAQDRLEEKEFISALGIPVAPFAAISSEQDFPAAKSQINGPGILKTRRLGYDGKGQARIQSGDELANAFDTVGGQPSILESLVPFAYEISALIVRTHAGETALYDLPVNTHKNGILDTSTVPSPLPEGHRDRAREIAETIAQNLDYVGLLAVEMFYLGPDAREPLIVNEIAPRVHNSGHWTMNACLTCQFENHIRAVAGWPLGPTNRHSDARMTNLIGTDHDRWPDLAAADGAVHLYGKNVARSGRKMGHVTQIWPIGTPAPERPV